MTEMVLATEKDGLMANKFVKIPQSGCIHHASHRYSLTS